MNSTLNARDISRVRAGRTYLFPFLHFRCSSATTNRRIGRLPRYLIRRSRSNNCNNHERIRAFNVRPSLPYTTITRRCRPREFNGRCRDVRSCATFIRGNSSRGIKIRRDGGLWGYSKLTRHVTRRSWRFPVKTGTS